MGLKVRVQSPNWWFRKVAPCQTHPFGPSLIQGNNLIKVSLYRVTIVVEERTYTACTRLEPVYHYSGTQALN